MPYALTRMRRKHRVLLTAWVFLPEHGHAIIDPPYPLPISRVSKALKLSSTMAANVRPGESGERRRKIISRAEIFYLTIVRWYCILELAGSAGALECPKACGQSRLHGERGAPCIDDGNERAKTEA